MASITLTGVLKRPNGELAVGDQIKFEHKSSTGDTVQTAECFVTIPPNGQYSVSIEYGIVNISYKAVTDEIFTNLGKATVNQDNPATNIPELLRATVPQTNQEMLEFQTVLANCIDAQNNANQSLQQIDALTSQQTTIELINSSANYDLDVVLQTSGFLTAGDGGGGKWKRTSGTGSPSESPEARGLPSLTNANGDVFDYVYEEVVNLSCLGMNESDSCGTIVNIGYQMIRDSYTFLAALTIPQMPLSITANPGFYFTNDSINAQLLTGTGWVVDFSGVAIEGRTQGKTVLDMLGCRFGRTIGLHIVGSDTLKPAIGIQYGRLEQNTSADNLQFINIKTSGRFTRAAAYNLASETEYWEHLELYNGEDGDDSGGYCHIFDGNNTFGAITDYAQPSMNQYDDMSIVQHTFVNPDWRKFTSSGPAIWMSKVRQFEVVGGYVVCNDDYAVIISCEGDKMRNLNFDMHLEKSTSLGLVRFEKNGGTNNTECTIAGFRHRDHNLQASSCAYKIGDSMTRVTLEDTDIHVENFFTTPINGLIAPLTKARIQGDIYVDDASVLKGFEFYGTLKSRNATSGAYGKGTYTIIDVASGRQWHKGNHNFLKDNLEVIPAGTLPSEDKLLIKEEAIQFPPSSIAPIIDANRFALALDDGSNWSGANATGKSRLVFWDGSTWILIA